MGAPEAYSPDKEDTKGGKCLRASRDTPWGCFGWQLNQPSSGGEDKHQAEEQAEHQSGRASQRDVPEGLFAATFSLPVVPLVLVNVPHPSHLSILISMDSAPRAR